MDRIISLSLFFEHDLPGKPVSTFPDHARVRSAWVMPVEIERKFLVKNDAWRAHVTHSERLRDGLVAREDDLKVRVRCYGNRTTLCVKGGRRGLSREEFEYEIPRDHAEAIFAHCTGRILEKTRHYVPGQSGVWEIDVYHDVL